MSLLPTALAFLQRGWSVIPVGLDKRPLILWKEYQSRMATPDELVKWFTDYPEAQIGVVTGEISNLTVIDVEVDGDFGVVTDQTLTVETGGKGRHFYFQYEKEFKNAVRVFPSVDVRSEGGYVVAPLSRTQKGAYTPLNDLPVAKMSSGTKEAFLEANRRQKPWFVDSSLPRVESYDQKSPEYSGSLEGGRNDSMTKYAGTLHAKLHQSLWASIGMQMFEEANRKNSPPLSQYELSIIWNSISQRELQQNPSGRNFSPAYTPRAWGPAPEVKKEAGVDLIPKHSMGDALSGPPDPSDLPQEISFETKHISDVADLQTIDSSKTFSTGMVPFDEALLGGFSLGELVVVAGQSGHGKTTLIQDWSVTLSSGGATKIDQLPSLWFSYEVLAKPLWQKFQLMGADINTPVYMPCVNESGDIDWVMDVIRGAIDKWGVKVICIDHLGFLRPPAGRYSNASDAITHTVRALKQFAVKNGLIVLLPVHIRKTNSKTPDLNDIRDSLGIAQEADSVFFIARDKDDAGLPTSQAKVWLVKNRKSGISVSATLDFSFGRYYYNPEESERREKFDSEVSKAMQSFDDD